MNLQPSRLHAPDGLRYVALTEWALGHGRYIASASRVMHHHSVRTFRNLLVATMLANTVSACVMRPASTPFVMVVRGDSAACTTTVGGRQVTADELRTIGQQESKRTQVAQIETDMAQTPYRCIGGTIYRLQEAGFTDVRFGTQPPAKR